MHTSANEPCRRNAVFSYTVIDYIVVRMKKFFGKSIDFTKVETLVYHLPNGPALSVEMEGLEELLDIDLEMGHVCDTSEIDGVMHFFPKGNA